MTSARRVQLYRVGLGLLGLVLFHLLSDIPLPGLAREWRDREALGTQDDLTFYERRFDTVRPELPARGVVGYRTQQQKKGTRDVFTYRAGRVLIELPVMESYWQSQYAVAPVILDASGEKHPLSVVNLTDGVRLVRGEGP